MDECVYEMVMPMSVIRDPSADIRTVVDDGIKLCHICGYYSQETRCFADPELKMLLRNTGCFADPKLKKILCNHYKPRSMANRMPEETKGTMDPKAERKEP